MLPFLAVRVTLSEGVSRILSNTSSHKQWRGLACWHASRHHSALCTRGGSARTSTVPPTVVWYLTSCSFLLPSPGPHTLATFPCRVFSPSFKPKGRSHAVGLPVFQHILSAHHKEWNDHNKCISM